jgi:hypothetical protein
MTDDHADSLDHLARTADQRPTVVTADASAKLREAILRVEQLRELPPPRPLVHGLLDLDSLAVLYGPPGAGKSVAALDLALRVATGTRWHHQQQVQRGPVLYIAAEGAHGMPARIDAWKSHTNTFHDPRDLRILPRAVNLFDPLHVATVIAYIEDTLAPSFVIVDTLARCMIGADENSSRDMSTAVAALDAIRIASGACVLVVHHTGKNHEAGARGHTALLGAADTMLRLGSTDRIVTLDQEKQKHHEPGHRQTFRLTSIAGSVALTPYSGADGEDLTGKTIDALAALADIETPDGVPFSLWVDAAIAAGGSKATTARTRAKALMNGLIEETEHGTKNSPRYRLTEAGRSHLPGAVKTVEEQA